MREQIEQAHLAVATLAVSELLDWLMLSDVANAVCDADYRHSCQIGKPPQGYRARP